MTIKNLLLIGKTGNGKSTIANVLTQTNLFAESAGSVSQTRIIQAEQFNHSEQSYSIIDTPGFFDTKLSQESILDIIAEAVYLVKDGLSQVLFVSKGRFDQFEMASYNILREIIFDKEISSHTTLIRTNFVQFNDQSECEKDLDAMKDQEDFREIVESCSLRFIHVNNPSLKAPRREKINQRKRDLSREKLLIHLETISQNENYLPTKLRDISKEIVELIEKKKEFEEKLKKLENRRKNSPETVKTSLNTEQSLSVNKLEKNDEINDSQYVSIIRKKISISQLRNLESERELLERKVIEKQIVIRNKILSHILHNAEKINELSLGKEFLGAVTNDGHDWVIIDPNFTLLFKAKWIEKYFKYAEVLAWKNALDGEFNVIDYGFCHWLQNIVSIQLAELKNHDLRELRANYAERLESDIADLKEIITEDWTKIDPSFSEDSPYDLSKNFQQRWEDLNLTYQDAEAWLASGFTVQDCHVISKWKNLSFTPFIVKELLGKGFDLEYDYLLASYARTKGYLNTAFNYAELKREYDQWNDQAKDDFEFLEIIYPLEVRKNARELNAGWSNIAGPLTITAAQWNSLERIFAHRSQSASLKINDCEKLNKINCSFNQLTNFALTNCVNLTYLDLESNQLTNDLNEFSDLVQLVHLNLRNNQLTGDLESLKGLIKLINLRLNNNPHITGSLQALQVMSKLYALSIQRTNIQVTLTARQLYLPAKMHEFTCNEFREGDEGTTTYHQQQDTNQSNCTVL